MKITTFFRTAKLLEPARFIGNSLFRKKAANEAIKRFCGDALPCGMSERSLRTDMMREKSRRWFTFDEYFQYRLYALSKRERKTFISDYERVHFLRQVNTEENAKIFGDKYETYLRFAKYYGREMLKISKSDEVLFRDFAARHPVFIVKPAHSSFGDGVRIFAAADYPDVWAEFIGKYPKGAVIEELIIQSELTGRLHPVSVNTLRVTTLRLDDRTENLFCFMRTGTGDRVVDNGGAGGIILFADPETGVVTNAVDELGRNYVTHPDTGVQLIGYRIPKFDDAVMLAKDLAKVIPSNRYTGWDLALTDYGWVMVEGNEAAQFIGYQSATLRGYRPELTKYYAELGITPKF